MNILTRPLFRVMCAGLLASAIVGCGNKGPLVLPAPPPAAEQPEAQEPVDMDDTDLPER
ncbi:MAG: lipoprotein [Stenotrophomonas sp.]